MDFSLLLTDEEYQKRFKVHPTPYTYILQYRGKRLFYFGVRHSNDPDDSQWEKLKKFWQDFSKTTIEPRAIFLEGGHVPLIVKNSLQDLIIKYGEIGALLYFTHGTPAEIVSADLPFDKETRQLSNKFEPDLVAYYIFARSAGAWLRTGMLGTFDEVLAKAANTTSRRIPGAPSDITSYGKFHERVFKKPLSDTQKETLIRASAPVYHDSVINEIVRASSRLRNEHIVSEVERYWQSGYSIFLLFGSAHAVVQEPALRAMIEKKPFVGE